jgi:putative transposase
MARRQRDLYAGIFHVWTHSVREELLFRRDRDRLHFLREVARAGACVDWACLAYCLMGTHYHLIVEVDDGALETGMHRLNFRYACWFNKMYGFRGHVMAARYGARRITDGADLLSTYRYVERNPVRADECDEPYEWRWSDYAAAVGLREPDDLVDSSRIFDCIEAPLEDRIDALRRYVEAPDA